VREIGKNARNQSNMASIEEYSDSDRVLVCPSQAEMLEHGGQKYSKFGHLVITF
jgi:hypothetical protein